jgi:hypothetical protein
MGKRKRYTAEFKAKVALEGWPEVAQVTVGPGKFQVSPEPLVAHAP